MNRHFAKLVILGAATMLFAGAIAAANNTASAPTNMFGGPVYAGPPSLTATAALVQAGGGAEHFTIQKALVSMLGEKTVDAEVAKLTKQYGKQKVTDWLNGFNFAVHDALQQVTAAGIKLPAVPEDLHGIKLAEALVDAGTAPDKVYWSGLLYDHALSHAVHNQVMVDIDAKYGAAYDMNLHAITNQAMFDVAQALGKKDVKLASLH